MKYRLSAKADRDVFAIFLASLRTFGLPQARRYHDGLLAEVDWLTAFPELARERTEFRRGLRFHPYGSHVIVYSIHGPEILVARVLHGRQQAERHLT